MKIELPVSDKIEVQGYLLYAFPLSILTAYSKGIHWTKKQYMDAFAYINDDNDVNVEFEDGVTYGNFSNDCDLLQMNYYTAADDVIALIEHSLCSEQYIILFLDEFYRPNSPHYTKRHYLHEIMIYGIDEYEIKYIAYDARKRYSRLSMNQLDLQKAYVSGNSINPTITSNWVKERRIILCKYNDECYFKEKTKILSVDETYTKRKYCAEKKRYYTIYCRRSIILPFIDAFDQYLLTGKSVVSVPYAAMHVLFESKQMLYRRWSALSDNFDPQCLKLALSEFDIARKLFYMYIDQNKNLKKQIERIRKCLIYGQKLENDIFNQIKHSGG